MLTVSTLLIHQKQGLMVSMLQAATRAGAQTWTAEKELLLPSKGRQASKISQGEEKKKSSLDYFGVPLEMWGEKAEEHPWAGIQLTLSSPITQRSIALTDSCMFTEVAF